MKIDDLSAWETFLGVAALGSFSRAAEQLKVPVPQVSKRVARLESRLGARLFQRTTRVVTLTDEGRALVPKIQAVLDDLRAAESLFEDRRPLSGTVKVTCVPFVAHKLLLPALGEFMRRHPAVHIELELSERFLNLVDSGFDMAVRIETPGDSDLVYRRLAPNDLVFCASPSYLKGRPPVREPEDLAGHDLLMLSLHRKVRFRNERATLGEFEHAKKLTCENGMFLTDLALDGFGILVRSLWDVQDHLKRGTLVRVLESHPLETFGYIHAVVPSKRYLAPRVRALMDFLVETSRQWGEAPYSAGNAS